MREKIGFIGLGTMGKPMALNLMKAGYELSVYDKNPKPLKEFQEKGATVGQSIREVASKSEVVITMVPNSGDVEDVILKENGAIEGLKSGSMVIDMSTIDPTVSRKISKILREKNIKMLDAPVSGGKRAPKPGRWRSWLEGRRKFLANACPYSRPWGKTYIIVDRVAMERLSKLSII